MTMDESFPTLLPNVTGEPEDFIDKCALLDTYTDSEMQRRAVYTLIGFISIGAAVLISLMMIWNPKLMMHPNKLILYMCISEALGTYHALVATVGVKSFICYFGLHKIWIETTFGIWDDSKATSLNRLQDTNYLMMQYFEFMSLVCNIFLGIDIILTLRSPFYPHSRRMKFYEIGAVIIPFFLTIFCIGRRELGTVHVISLRAESGVSALFMSGYILFAIFSSAYAFRLTTRPGMSAELRTAFIEKHVELMVVYVITWLPYLGLTYNTLYLTAIFGPDFNKENPAVLLLPQNQHIKGQLDNWILANNFAALTTGFLMSVVRVREPIFWRQARTYFWQFWGEIIPEDTDLDGANSSANSSTLLSFLMSSLNIELVHIILTAVSEKTVGTAKSIDDHHVYMNYDHTNENTFIIDCIEIPDREEWDVGAVFTKGPLDRKRNSTFRKDGAPEVEFQKKLIINEDIRVTEYAPDVFAFLRERDGYDNRILRESLNPETNKSSVFKAGESQGKSGSFFFFSKDQRFIIKTMT